MLLKSSLHVLCLVIYNQDYWIKTGPLYYQIVVPDIILIVVQRDKRGTCRVVKRGQQIELR